MNTDQERYARGREALRQIMGAQAESVYELEETAPELARFTVEAFGDIYANPALDVQTREIATVAALTALGYAPRQLRAHLHGALNVGVSRQALVEIITQMHAYAGFPAALNAMAIAKEVFAERDKKEAL
jgi:4-carboxymuconolactone decarboxylase